MQLTNIVSLVNSNLAGELLTLNQMIPFLDQTIDEINDKLNTNFPAFSELDPNEHADYPDYNFFPDMYIRSVVCVGAAYYFYITDEEGVNAAPMYQQMYQAALFRMERDYLPKVDEIWKKPEPTGYLPDPFAYGIATGDYYDTHDFDETGSLYPLVKIYEEGPQGIQGLLGPQGEPGISITRISEDETSFYVHLSDGTIKQLSKPEGIIGLQGETGKSIEYTWNGTQLGVRIEGETNYTYVNLKGDKGDIGNTGKSLEFNWNGTQLGIRQEGDAAFQYVNLKGDKGDTGDTGDKGDTGNGLEFTLNGTQLGIRVEGEAQYQYVDLKGEKGDTGNGISSIVKTSGTGAAGTTDTYTITFTNDTTTTFEVYNGADGQGSGDMSAVVYDSDGDGVVNAADSVPWDGVSGKPDTFPPNPHDHDASYIKPNGDASNTTVTFAASTTEEDILSGESQATLFGKILKSISTFRTAITNIINGTTKVGKAIDADTVGGFTVAKNVPSNAVFTDTVTTVNGKTGAIVKADVVALGIPAQDTDTTYDEATTSANGLMSSTDKTKLDGIATGANNYSHPTSAGNKHVPTGGSSGQLLGYSASGTAKWVAPSTINAGQVDGKSVWVGAEGSKGTDANTIYFCY